MGKKPLTTELWILFCNYFYLVSPLVLRVFYFISEDFFYMIFTRRNMFSEDEIREILPYPIRLEIYCNETFLEMGVIELIKELRKKHNKNRDSKIESISVDYINKDYVRYIENNKFKIYVGNQLIHEGKVSSLIDNNLKLCEKFYTSLVSLIEGILNIWHDEIIKVQKENGAKLKELEEEGYDELLYAYYHFNSDKKAFIYLKKLATRYPNSKYMKKLVRIYRLGLHESKPKLWKKKDKSTNRGKHKDF